MYVHAYQSLVWNFAVGERWRLFGDQVVAGDLVLVNEFKDKTGKNSRTEEVDADGELVVLPSIDDVASTADDIFERARALSAEEAVSGIYTIFDVVLPLPGFDVLYPANEMTDFYKRFMASERGGGLDPFNMRRKWKDISLSGSYRKVLGRPGPDYSFEVRKYAKDDQQFMETDLEKLRGKKNDDANAVDEQKKETEEELPDKVAVIIKLQLGSSQYATMALRELMKTGGVKTYKPDFGGGR
jgi:tRNA pseudouridine13 synthase